MNPEPPGLPYITPKDSPPSFNLQYLKRSLLETSWPAITNTSYSNNRNKVKGTLNHVILFDAEPPPNLRISPPFFQFTIPRNLGAGIQLRSI